MYVSGDELVAMEQARLTLRAKHDLVVDRARLVREAVAVLLAEANVEPDQLKRFFGDGGGSTWIHTEDLAGPHDPFTASTETDTGLSCLGLIELSGEEWSARAFDEYQVIPVGALVDVMEIEGATAIVYPRELLP